MTTLLVNSIEYLRNYFQSFLNFSKILKRWGHFLTHSMRPAGTKARQRHHKKRKVQTNIPITIDVNILNRTLTDRSLQHVIRDVWAPLVAQLVKNLPAMWETWVPFLSWEDLLEKRKATHSSILAWRLLWTVWSMGSQRVRHN